MKNILSSQNKETSMMFYSDASFSFEHSSKNHKTYVPYSKTHESYLSLLRCLFGKADIIILIADSPTNLETTLQPWLTSQKIDENNRTVSTYPYTPEIFSILSEYENFFAYEEDLQIQFYQGATCLLNSIPHHEWLSLSAEYFTDIDLSFLETEKHEREKLATSSWDAVTNCRLYPLSVDEWQRILPKLYTCGESISFGGAFEPFTEEIFNRLQTLPDFFAEETIQISRNGYLIFASNRAEKTALVDLAFTSKGENILPAHHPIIRAYKKYVHDYATAKEQGKLYSPEHLSPEEYTSLVEKLFARSDDLCLITESDTAPILNGDIGEAPAYPGKYERSGITAYHYPLSEEIMNYFLAAQDFFSFGETTDIVFSRKQKTVLCTDHTQKRCVIDPWFLEETTELIRFSDGKIMSEGLTATLMNIHGIASCEEAEKTFSRDSKPAVTDTFISL